MLAFFVTLVAATPPPPQKTLTQFQVQAREPTGRALIAQFATPRPPSGSVTSSAAAAALVAGARAQISSAWQEFGLSHGADLPDWELKYVAAPQAPRGGPQPGLQDADLGPDLVIRIRPWHRNLPVKGESVTLQFQDSRLILAIGVVRGRAELDTLFTALGSRIRVAQSRWSSQPDRCGGNPEFEDSQPVVDFAARDIYQRYRCDGQDYKRRFDGASDVAIEPEADPAYAAYVTPGVTVKTLANSPSPQSGGTVKWNWFPATALGLPGTWATPPVAWATGTIMDRDVLGGGSCNFRMSYGGDRSVYPFPTTQKNSSTVVRFSLNECPVGQYVHGYLPNSLDFDVQATHRRLSQYARYAAWAYNMRLIAWYAPPDQPKLKVQVKKTLTDCGGNLGLYTYWSSTMCINSAQGSPYDTPVHEYGHYIADLYNAQGGGNCDVKAMKEGYADAMRLWFEQWRNSTQYFGATELNDLYWRGAGDNPCRGSVNGGSTMVRCPQVVGGYGTPIGPSSVDASCIAWNSMTSEFVDEPYTKGMVLSQVLFPFLTNRVCETLPCAPAGVTPLLDNITLSESADVGRQDFQHALMAAADNSNLMAPRPFVQTFATEMKTWHKVDFFDKRDTPQTPGANWSRVSQMFGRHGVTP